MDKEKALNEKIAAIRAKNEALQLRHAEVEADKKFAEEIKSSVTCLSVKKQILGSSYYKKTENENLFPKSQRFFLRSSSTSNDRSSGPLSEIGNEKIKKENEEKSTKNPRGEDFFISDWSEDVEQVQHKTQSYVVKSRIPSRFLKTSISFSSKEISKKKFELNIKGTSDKMAPISANRLTIYCPSYLVSKLDEFTESQRCLSVCTLEELSKALVDLDPKLDKYLLIHCLGDDTRSLSLQPYKTNQVKSFESDVLANDFCDIIETILERIPYLTIFLSSLFPRFDHSDNAFMGNPNNVRKIINIQISVRLSGNASIVLLDNDEVLNWVKDEEHKTRLFQENGTQLTEFGIKTLNIFWKTKLMENFSQEDLS